MYWNSNAACKKLDEKGKSLLPHTKEATEYVNRASVFLIHALKLQSLGCLSKGT